MRLSITTNFPEVQRALDQLRQDIATKVNESLETKKKK